MKTFLENLENQLTLLEESERKKIIKSYQDKIKKNQQEGMSEEASIQELGQLEDIVEKIYEQYHINKNEIPKKKTLGQRWNDAIKTCANFLAETLEEIIFSVKTVSEGKSLEVFFEILLKIVVLIILFMILKIPVLLLEELCKFIATMLFYPFNSVVILLSSFLLSILYLLLCFILSVTMFKGYANKKGLEEPKEKKEVERISINRNYAFMFLKVIIYVVAIIPMILLTITFFLLTLLAAFFVYKEVHVIGLVIIFLGFFLLSLTGTRYITDAFDNTNKSHRISLLSSIVLLIIGGIVLVDNMMNFHYPKTLEDSSFQPITETLTMTIEQETNIYNLDGDYTFELDKDMQDNEILIEVTYYDELYDVTLRTDKTEDKNYLWIFSKEDEFSMSQVQYLYTHGMEDLKKKNIYDYQKLESVTVTIYGNEVTKELLNIE